MHEWPRMSRAGKPAVHVNPGDQIKECTMKMQKLAMCVAIAFAAASVNAQTIVGGAEMLQSKDIVDNAMNSQDHTTLVAAVKAADLVPTLKGAGPFTVFAPTNAAFAQLPAGTVETLLKPENKPMLAEILTYHVVPGRIDAAALQQRIAEGNGKASLTTVAGENLTATSSGGTIMLTDARGGMSHVTTADVQQSNGVIHVVDKVVMPAGKTGSRDGKKRASTVHERTDMAMGDTSGDCYARERARSGA